MRSVGYGSVQHVDIGFLHLYCSTVKVVTCQFGFSSFA